MALPISEQIVANLVSSLSAINGTGLYKNALTSIIRADASFDDQNAENLQAVVWDASVEPEKDKKVPWGQQEWMHLIEVHVYLRQAKADNTPISQRINLLLADVLRAVFTDWRRGGLCYVDNEVEKIEIYETATSGIFALSVIIRCEYRTVRGDPNTVAPGSPNEQFFQGGATLLIAPYTSDRQFSSWRRLSDLHITPEIDEDLETINSDRAGLTRPTDILYSGHRLKFSATADYQNQDILSWRFGSGATSAVSQSAQAFTAVPHLVQSGDTVLPLHDAQQNTLYSVLSVTSVTNGMTPYTPGTDYIIDAVSLSQGIILIPPTSSIPPGTVYVTGAAGAVTTRSALPAGTACDSRYRARIIWTDATGLQLIYGDFDCSINVTISTADLGMLNTTTFTIAVLDDQSGTPGGKLVTIGKQPSIGF